MKDKIVFLALPAMICLFLNLFTAKSALAKDSITNDSNFENIKLHDQTFEFLKEISRKIAENNEKLFYTHPDQRPADAQRKFFRSILSSAITFRETIQSSEEKLAFDLELIKEAARYGWCEEVVEIAEQWQDEAHDVLIYYAVATLHPLKFPLSDTLKQKLNKIIEKNDGLSARVKKLLNLSGELE